ncbi:MAG: hypothetical protein Q9173_000647 [Seirophora scorigena]
MASKHGPGDMGPPPVPSRGRSRRIADKSTSKLQAVVIQTSPSSSSSSPSLYARRRRLSDYAVSQPLSPESQTSSTATGFTDRVKVAIIQLTGDKCWHCDSEWDLEYAHIIEKRDALVLKELQSTGDTNLINLHQEQNGMRLCVTCHRAYDDKSQAGWVFIPTDLDYFVREEHLDHNRRLEHYRANNAYPTRICPTIEAYMTRGGMYDAYMLRQHGPPSSNWRPGRSTHLPTSKYWPGDPMVALYRAFKGAFRKWSLLPRELRDLGDLYERNDIAPGPDFLTSSSLGLRPDSYRDHDSSNGAPRPLSPSTRSGHGAARAKGSHKRQSSAQKHGRDSKSQKYHTRKKRRIVHLKEEKDEKEEATRPISLKTPWAYGPQETSEGVKFIRAPWAWGPEATSEHKAAHHRKLKAAREVYNSQYMGKEVVQLPSPEASRASNSIQAFQSSWWTEEWFKKRNKAKGRRSRRIPV